MIAAAVRAALKTIQEEKSLESKEIDSEEACDDSDSESGDEDEMSSDKQTFAAEDNIMEKSLA